MKLLSSADGITTRRRDGLLTVLVAFLAGIAGVAGSYALAGFTPTFVVAPIAGFLVRAMPAVIVAFAITTLGSLGDQLNLVAAGALAVFLLAVTSLVALVVGKRLGSSLVAIGLTALLGWLAAASVTGVTMPAPSALGAGAASAIVVAVTEFAPNLAARRSGAETGPISEGRRRVIGGLVSALAVGLFGYVLGGQGMTATASTASLGPGVKRQQLLDEAAAKSLDIPGIDPLISEIDSFYEVDINNIDPVVDPENWTLSITGAVERERTLSYDDVTSMAATDRFYTLRCVGDSLNGEKMDNAIWTGVPILDVLSEANPQGNYVSLRAADDYTVSFPLAALGGGMLAYGMNGEDLPQSHGFPVRVLVPGHWGETNPKWITEIEITDRVQMGYWEQRGWHGTGPVKTVARFHAINSLDDGRIQIGGHAYAGTRGISRVEVSIDGGPWTKTTLSEPLSGEDVWRQWEYKYEPPKTESHEVVVRATDGTGTLQPREGADPFPNGPSGWVSRTVNMMADG